MNIVMMIVVGLLVLTVVVLIHELGHFLTARLFGVRVEEFGIGLPPRVVGKKVGKTIYSVNALPIGGFVKLAGEDVDDEDMEKAKTQKHEQFWAKSKKARGIILSSGVAANALLAIIVTAFLLTQGVPEPAGLVKINKIVPASPSANAGLLVGDVVRTADVDVTDGTASKPVDITTNHDLITFTSTHTGQSIILGIDRAGERSTVRLVPRVDPPKGEGPLGIQITDVEVKVYSWYQAPVKAVQITYERAVNMITIVADTLWRLVTFQKIRTDVAGPVGIAQVTGQAVKHGWKAVLEFVSILSLNLAILNILPIPALDGGRIAFLFIEKFIGRRVRPAFERSTHQVGMILLLFFVLMLTINDILRIVRG